MCLEHGLKLDLNRLIKEGLVSPGSKTDPRANSLVPHLLRRRDRCGLISANMQGTLEGWLRIEIGGLDQWIMLISAARHYGGRQWYFACPKTERRASVLWMPPGARRFASRHAWRRQVAYSSQFMDPINRAHHGQARIKSRLIADLDPEEWSLPPKPKWMRWRTYNRFVDRFDRYEAALDSGTLELVAKLMAKVC